ncbi:MAG: DNA repair protein RadC [Deltaproteobacteria bacterium]|nr:DNA repair protein RadC [Deltaproteobacteria bacterium]
MDGRERMLHEGPSLLSEQDLLALVLGTGTQKEPVPELSARLLRGGLHELARAQAADLVDARGIGLAQACRITAAIELGRRALRTPPPKKERLIRAGAIASRLWYRLAHLEHEEFWALLLTTRLEELRAVRISTGGLTHCSVLPREAFRAALIANAPCVAFLHNHPSGDPEPSPEDQRLELHLEEAGSALGVRVIDHLVLAANGIHSAREGRLPPPFELAFELDLDPDDDRPGHDAPRDQGAPHDHAAPHDHDRPALPEFAGDPADNGCADD